MNEFILHRDAGLTIVMEFGNGEWAIFVLDIRVVNTYHNVNI